MIEDQTYFVVESSSGRIVGCGGWGKRKTLYGASRYKKSRDSSLLDPESGPARIRAFFVHPDWTRKGIGKKILQLSEAEASSCGFKSAEMMATLPGVEFYKSCGYIGNQRISIPIGEGIFIDCILMKKSFGLTPCPKQK